MATAAVTMKSCLPASLGSRWQLHTNHYSQSM
jgi:hypothetical protein